MSETKQKCPICSGMGTPHFCNSEYRMYKCCDCLTVFLFPMPSVSFLNNFYARFHESYEHGGGYELFEAATCRTFSKKIEIIRQKFCDPNGKLRLLDVGCGKGYFVKACIEKGIDAQGIDLSPTAIKQAQMMGLPCRTGRVEDFDSDMPQFDVVTFWATIEHVPDPLETLTRMTSLVKPGGHLFLDTGVGSDWLDYLLPGVVQWYDPPRHLFVFSRKGMKCILEKAGLTVISIDANFESSTARRFIRIVRGLIFGATTRLASIFCAVTQKPTFSTKFSLGNLMFVEAKRR